MKIVKNKILPPKDFLAINIFGTLFVKEEDADRIDQIDINHESIHTAQMKDFCSFLPIGGLIFYIVYFFEWLWRLKQLGIKDHKAYYNISFEKEAFKHQLEFEYLETRKRFAQWKK